MSRINSFNPYDSFRVGQRESIEDIIKAALNGSRIIEYRAPTGAGKSNVLTIVSKVLREEGFERTTYTTPQRSLVFQLANDKNLNITTLLGRANYPCKKVKSGNAADCPVPAKQRRKTCPRCPYQAAKDVFLAAPLGATTLAKILVDRSIPTPDIMVVDEAQGIEMALIEQRSIQLPDRVDLQDLEESVRLWVRDTELEVMKYESKLERSFARIAPEGTSDEVKSLMGFVDTTEATRTAKTLDKIQRVAERAKGVLRAIQEDRESFVIDPKTRAFKLLYGREQFREMIMNIKCVILASGTPCTQILAPDYAKIVAPHPVSVDRRRVYFSPCGKMNYQDRETTMDAMGPKIAELHKKYNRNTLVHCHSFAIADTLGNIIRDQGIDCIWVEKKGREESIQKWKDVDNCCLLAVACEEGLDLPGEKYPLNIIAKVPFLPYRSDEWTDRRKARDNKLPTEQRWENVSVALAIQQAAGRCTRGPSDFSETYIMDTSFEYFYKRNHMLFEDWFRDALMRKDT